MRRSVLSELHYFLTVFCMFGKLYLTLHPSVSIATRASACQHEPCSRSRIIFPARSNSPSRSSVETELPSKYTGAGTDLPSSIELVSCSKRSGVLDLVSDVPVATGV